jgi:predicted transcriptional regulator of viral defense system
LLAGFVQNGSIRVLFCTFLASSVSWLKVQKDRTDHFRNQSTSCFPVAEKVQYGSKNVLYRTKPATLRGQMIELYRKFRDQGVFRKEQVIANHPGLDRNAINTMIERAKRETKVVKSIDGRRGIYFIVEPGQDYGKALVDPNKVAANIAPGATICYASALAFLGKSHSSRTVYYVSSENRFRSLIYQGVRYQYVALPRPKLYVEHVPYKGSMVRVTILERTLIDCLRNIKYAGGFEQLYRSFEGVPYINSKTLAECLKQFSSPRTTARVAFFLELFKAHWGIEDPFFKRLERNVPKTPDYFLARESRGGRLIRRWNLIVPEDILTLGGYHGH